jgi:hypothetical protein
MNLFSIIGIIDTTSKLSADGVGAILVGAIASIVTIVATILNVWAVNKNTTKQIDNQNKQTYQPHLKKGDSKFVSVKSIENSIHYFVKSKYCPKTKKDLGKACLEIELCNHGYGIATNINFYNLLTGELISTVEDINVNRDDRESVEILKDEIGKFDFIIDFNKSKCNPSKIQDNDYLFILCDYQDLNQNHYKLIIKSQFVEAIIDNFSKYDELACTTNDDYYQEGTYIYRKTIENYKDKYSKIEEIIKELDK